jgi:hypothetical protein
VIHQPVFFPVSAGDESDVDTPDVRRVDFRDDILDDTVTQIGHQVEVRRRGFFRVDVGRREHHRRNGQSNQPRRGAG